MTSHTDSETGAPLRVSVVVCSIGRPDTLAQLLPWLRRQTVAPSEIVFVVTSENDLPPQTALEGEIPVEVIFSDKGLPKQRNRGLDHVMDRCDAVLFIDDDYLPARTAVAGVVEGFRAFPDIAGLTGRLLADGIRTGGVSYDAAQRLIEAHERDHATPPEPTAIKRDLLGLYGCNMAYRTAAIGETRFDERLPLYGWQEDVDFASRLPGEKLKTDALNGVHLGTTSGRETSGQLLGYSQVANTLYLISKGSLTRKFGLRLMVRNVVANHLKMFRPEPWIDRKARAHGNWIAFFDTLRGRVAPERILDLIARKKARS